MKATTLAVKELEILSISDPKDVMKLKASMDDLFLGNFKETESF